MLPCLLGCRWLQTWAGEKKHQHQTGKGFLNQEKAWKPEIAREIWSFPFSWGGGYIYIYLCFFFLLANSAAKTTKRWSFLQIFTRRKLGCYKVPHFVWRDQMSKSQSWKNPWALPREEPFLNGNCVNNSCFEFVCLSLTAPLDILLWAGVVFNCPLHFWKLKQQLFHRFRKNKQPPPCRASDRGYDPQIKQKRKVGYVAIYIPVTPKWLLFQISCRYELCMYI